MIFVAQVTPATPMLLLVAAPMVPAMRVPWKLLLIFIENWTRKFRDDVQVHTGRDKRACVMMAQAMENPEVHGENCVRADSLGRLAGILLSRRVPPFPRSA